MSPGALILSLDFELHWGVRDHTTVEAYRTSLLGARTAIPQMLDLFRAHDVGATWATVGFLFAETKRDLEKHVPRLLPSYADARMSPYEAMGEVGDDEKSDPFHFGASLVRRIAETPKQELATHTFSHFYCLEPGQTPEQFEADLEAAAAIGAPYGDTCQSIVFPRNQLAPAYLDVLRRRGVRAYRSNGEHWAYRASKEQPAPARLFRLADAYLPLSGARAHERPAPHVEAEPVDVMASAFLRPYSPRLRHLDDLRYRRLAGMMTKAAKEGRAFHLWWHPHNFGAHPRESLAFLAKLLVHFGDLRRRYGMESLTMAEMARATERAA